VEQGIVTGSILRKSIAILSHGWVGIFNGVRYPIGNWVEPFVD